MAVHGLSDYRLNSLKAQGGALNQITKALFVKFCGREGESLEKKGSGGQVSKKG